MIYPEWELVDGTTVPERLLQDIAVAEERIAIEAMHVVADEVTLPIFNRIAHKAKFDPELAARTVVLPDAYSLVHWEDAEQKGTIPQLVELLNELGKLGVTAHFGREFGSGPLGALRGRLFGKSGRNHSKIYIADDVSYSFGGCNFNKANLLERHDFLLRSTDPEVADLLEGVVRQEVDHDGPRADEVYRIGELDTVIVDGGQRNHSTIQRVAELLLREAVPGSVRFVSQFRPSDSIEESLSEGVVSVFNRGEKFKGLLKIQQLQEASNSRLRNIVHPDRFVHAKCITAELEPDENREFAPHGGPVVLTGSHNFHLWGIKAGTGEIALLSQQAKLVDQVNNWIDQSFEVEPVAA